MSSPIFWPSDRPVDARVTAAMGLVRTLDEHAAEGRALEPLAPLLALAAEDPHPRVRLALADAIGSNPNAPLTVIAQLATDRPDIAGLVIARSPVIGEADLVELSRRLDPRLLPVLATRVRSDRTATFVVAMGDATAATALLLNPDVELSASTLDEIASANGENARVRELLLQRADLPISARYALVERLCSVLATSGIVSNILGAGRTRSILDEAQGEALIVAAGGQPRAQIDLLVSEVAERAGIDALTLLRALCFGELELFEALSCRLSNVAPRRVRAMCRASRPAIIRGLMERCGLAAETAALLADVHAIARDARSANAIMASTVMQCRPVCPTTSTLLTSVRRWAARTQPTRSADPTLLAA